MRRSFLKSCAHKARVFWYNVVHEDHGQSACPFASGSGRVRPRRRRGGRHAHRRRDERPCRRDNAVRPVVRFRPLRIRLGGVRRRRGRVFRPHFRVRPPVGSLVGRSMGRSALVRPAGRCPVASVRMPRRFRIPFPQRLRAVPVLPLRTRAGLREPCRRSPLPVRVGRSRRRVRRPRRVHPGAFVRPVFFRLRDKPLRGRVVDVSRTPSRASVASLPARRRASRCRRARLPRRRRRP